MGSSGPILVVAGFIDEFAKQSQGCVVTNVEPITDEAKRKELTESLVKQGYKKKIVFWNQ